MISFRQPLRISRPWSNRGVASTHFETCFELFNNEQATISVGYAGNYAGPNLLPALFTLNVTVCTTR